MSISESRRTSKVSTGVSVGAAKATALGAAGPGDNSSWWTFFAGAGSALEMFPPAERIGPRNTEAEAVAQDWQAVADDMWAAIDSYETDQPSVGAAAYTLSPPPSESANEARSAKMPPPKSPGVDWPAPEILEAYERLAPGSAKAILEDFLKKSERRQTMEQQSLSARISIARWGQFFGFAIGITALIAGAYTATQGYQVAGSFIGTGGVVGLVSVFVLGRIKLGETTVDR